MLILIKKIKYYKNPLGYKQKFNKYWPIVTKNTLTNVVNLTLFMFITN